MVSLASPSHPVDTLQHPCDNLYAHRSGAGPRLDRRELVARRDLVAVESSRCSKLGIENHDDALNGAGTRPAEEPLSARLWFKARAQLFNKVRNTECHGSCSSDSSDGQ